MTALAVVFKVQSSRDNTLHHSEQRKLLNTLKLDPSDSYTIPLRSVIFLSLKRKEELSERQFYFLKI